MASQPPPPPESIVLNQFSGLKNTVTPERLTGADLQRATNIDLDDSGQPRRRRGYTLKITGEWHSIFSDDAKVYGVKDGTLGIVRANYTFVPLTFVGNTPVAYVDVAGDIYFASRDVVGIIAVDETLKQWGALNGQGQWLSPVLTPTTTLGAVSGRLLGDPVNASYLALYNGRIYMAKGNILWATELYQFNYIDRTRNFMQFEGQITMLMAMTDGLFVGTDDGLYFIQGVLESFKLNLISPAAVLPGSATWVSAEAVHPLNLTRPIPVEQAIVFMTTEGVLAGFDTGACYNLTYGRFEFPKGISAAALMRRDLGATSYVATVDSGGSPAAAARMGDYVSAEIIRFGGNSYGL